MQASASGGPRNSSPGTLNKLFFEAIERHKKPDTLQVKKNGVYQPISSRDLADRVRQVALGLRELGINRGDRVAILSENRPEWAIADYACLTAGLTDVPIYPTLPAEQIPYILNDAGAVAVFTSTPEQAAKIAQVRGQLTSLRHVIGFDDTTRPGETMTLEELRRKGESVDNAQRTAAYRQDAMAVKPDDVATLIYTSGTTGDPKAVMITHTNVVWTAQAVMKALGANRDEVSISYLPLSHIAEQMTTIHGPMALGSIIYFAESLEKLGDALKEVRPTLFLGVPRVWEKIQAKMVAVGASASGSSTPASSGRRRPRSPRARSSSSSPSTCRSSRSTA